MHQRDSDQDYDYDELETVEILSVQVKVKIQLDQRSSPKLLVPFSPKKRCSRFRSLPERLI